MPASISEYSMIMPFIIIGILILLSIVIEISSKKSEIIIPWLSILTFFIIALYSLLNINQNEILFNGMLEVGGKAAIFNFIFNLGALLVTINSIDYIKKYGSYYGEYYILIQSSVLGMMIMAGAGDLIMIFLGLELMSICFYVLAGINRKKLFANEASMKYFLLGAFATGFIVYGIALIYGISGTTNLSSIMTNFSSLISNIIFITGFVLFLVGFSFKIAAVPFHMWVPDVYQGSATTVTGLMSTIGKSAAFSVLILSLTAIIAFKTPNNFRNYFAVISTLSMLAGSIIAISQNNLKRMLAYSSIAHAGYMSIGLAAGNITSIAGIIFYLAAYTFINLGAFGIISIVEGEDDSRTDLDSFTGLNSKNPLLAALMSLFMFALAGIPPLAGFFGKYYVFVGAIESGLTWLAIIGVLASVISVYFYLRVVVLMYFKEPAHNFNITLSPYSLASVIICSVLVIIFGLVPDLLMNLITSVVY
ncbi:NADH-quinone oxidoreductase subunit N [Rosettibacter firmus]|uniref:NADH-quinone oxidoreductase subunit N n=1 Tax=Rosettibacter firmus TaxID=3111522 RepID=UPI00336C2185